VRARAKTERKGKLILLSLCPVAAAAAAIPPAGEGDVERASVRAPQISHPVRRPGSSRLLDRPPDALEVAVKVQRPLVEVAGRERGDAARHVEALFFASRRLWLCLTVSENRGDVHRTVLTEIKRLRDAAVERAQESKKSFLDLRRRKKKKTATTSFEENEPAPPTLSFFCPPRLFSRAAFHVEFESARKLGNAPAHITLIIMASSSLGARSGETTPATAGLEEGTLASAPIAVPKRILMGPGPSNAHPRVLAAQGDSRG